LYTMIYTHKKFLKLSVGLGSAFVKVKVKAFPYLTQALDPELIPVYRQSAHR